MMIIGKHVASRIIALATCFTFIYQSIAPIGKAQAHVVRVASSSDGSLAHDKVDIASINLPVRFGEIISSFKGPLDKTIIHIRDAHCDYSAQHSISGIIEYFRNAHGIDLIALEGGAGAYDLSVFTDIKDKDLREKVADYFVKEGEVNGAEYYAVNNPQSVILYGIEDPSLYMENLYAYRDSLKLKDDADKCISRLTGAARSLKEKLYSKELKVLDEKIKQFKSGKIDFKDYVLVIADFTKERNIDMKMYPSVALFLQTMEEKKAINLKESERERNVLIDMLNKRLPKKYLEELAANTEAFNDGNIAPDVYYEYLFKMCEPCGIDPDGMQNLIKYVACIKRSKDIDKKALSKEFKTLEESVFNSLFILPDQKELYTLDNKLFILRGMNSVNLDKESWDYYTAHREEFSAKNLTSFVSSKVNVNCDAMCLDDYRERMEKFYALSLKRDDAFINNIVGKIKKEDADNIILVTGGFHQDNLKDLFKDKGYSYVEVLPKIEKQDGAGPYFKLLSGGSDPIMRAIDESRSTLQIATYLDKTLSVTVHGAGGIDSFALAVSIVKEIFDKGKAVYKTMPDGSIVKFDMGREPEDVTGKEISVQPTPLTIITYVKSQNLTTRSPVEPPAPAETAARPPEISREEGAPPAMKRPAIPMQVPFTISYPVQICSDERTITEADIERDKFLKERLNRNIYYSHAPPGRQRQIIERTKDFARIAVPYLKNFMKQKYPRLDLINMSLYGSYPYGDEGGSPSDADIIIIVSGSHFSRGETIIIDENSPEFKKLKRSVPKLSVYIIGEDNFRSGITDDSARQDEDFQAWQRRQRLVIEGTLPVIYRRNIVLWGKDFIDNLDLRSANNMLAKLADLLLNSYRRIFNYRANAAESEFERIKIGITRLYDIALILEELSPTVGSNPEEALALRKRFENGQTTAQDVKAEWIKLNSMFESIVNAMAPSAAGTALTIAEGQGSGVKGQVICGMRRPKISYGDRKTRMEEILQKMKDVAALLFRNLFDGAACYTYVLGAIPTDENGKPFNELEYSSSITKERNDANRFINERSGIGAGNINISHAIGIEKAKEKVRELANLPPDLQKERIYCAISAFVLQKLEEDTQLKKEIGKGVEKLLSERTMLNIVDDFEGKKVYLMPYLEVTVLGLSRINLVEQLRKSNNLDSEGCKKAIDAFSRAMGLVSNLSAEDVRKISSELLAAAKDDPMKFFRDYTFKIAVPPITKIRFEEIEENINAMIEAWRSL